MALLNQSGKAKFSALALILTFLVFPAVTIAGDAIEAQTLEPKTLTLVSGKSIVLRSVTPISRVSVAAPAVADFLMLSAN
jgi:hypothetical protein